MLVTPRSVLSLRVLDHNSFRKDATFGEKKFNLHQILTHYNGKCENLEVTLDLMSDGKHDSQQVKVGELIALLDGLRLDMNVLGRTNSNPGPMPLGPTSSEAVASRSVLNNGVKVRMRLHGSENVVPTMSRSVRDMQIPYTLHNSVTNGSAVAIGPPPIGPPPIGPPPIGPPPPNGVPNGVTVSPESNRGANPVPEEPLPPGWEMR